MAITIGARESSVVVQCPAWARGGVIEAITRRSPRLRMEADRHWWTGLVSIGLFVEVGAWPADR
jgi:hypothetical protein